jgi:hypothetical protein
VPTTNMDGTEGCAVSNDYGNERERYQTAETVAQGCQIKDKCVLCLQVIVSIIYNI